MLNGVDISHYNTVTDWARVAAGGVSFAVSKATEGTSFVDPTFRGNTAGATRAGLVAGGYHVLRTGDVPGQVKAFLAAMNAAGNPPLHQVDYEQWQVPGGVDRPSYPTLREFISEHRQQSQGHPIMLYTGEWVWRLFHNPGFGARDLGVPLWASKYVGGSGSIAQLLPKVPTSFWDITFGGWKSPAILQYTSLGRVPGIDGNVDLNAFRGKKADLLALATGKAAPATGSLSMELPGPISIHEQTADARLVPWPDCPVMPVGFGGPESPGQAGWVAYFFTLLSHFDPGYLADIKTHNPAELARNEIGRASLTAMQNLAHQVWGAKSPVFNGVIPSAMWRYWQPDNWPAA